MLTSSAPRVKAVNILENFVKMTKFSDKSHKKRDSKTFLTNAVSLISNIYRLKHDIYF